jgi:DHA1 family tetracycline resistance protein-like MFS transporter
MTAEATPIPGRAAFAFVFVTVVLDMLALGIVVPVLPKLIKSFMGGDSAGAADIVGYFGAAWALMQFVFQPVLGTLSDRFGRRPVIILSNFGLGLDYVLMALAPDLWFLFVGRLISGVTAASFSTAGAYIADVTPPEKRAQRFGMMGAGFGLGFIIGPALGGVLGAIDLRLPFWGAAGLSLVNAAYGFFVLPESLPRALRTRFDWRKANPWGSFVLLRSRPVLAALAGVGFLQRFAHNSLPSMFVLYTDYRYGWDARTVGLSLAGVGVLQMIVSGGLVGPVVKRLGERLALIVGLASGMAGFVVMATAPNGVLFLISMPLLAIFGLANPALQGLITRQVGQSQQGQLQGAQGSLYGIADMLGPLLFTQSFALAIAAAGPDRLPGTPYLLAAGLLACGLAVAWRSARRPSVAAA